MTTIVLVAALTLLASFLCSLFEAALYAITPAQVELARRRKISGAERLAQLRRDVEEPIAAILTVNTVAHTIGAAWLGAMVGERYGSRAVGIFAAVFTVAVLAVTEIVPKSLGVRYAKWLGPRVAAPIQIMSWISWPIARPSRAIMGFLIGHHGHGAPSEDEVVLASDLAARAGKVRSIEHRWVRNALHLDRLTAGDLRTPRTVVYTLDASRTVGDVTAEPGRWVHSRVPVVEDGDLDRVVGVVLRRDVFDAAARGDTAKRLGELMRELPLVPEAMPAHELLDRFVRGRAHMVGVVDEYGGLEGVVTLEDVLEELIGEEIVDEHDRHVDMQAEARARAGRKEPGTEAR